ncbi:hypothetical protein [Treponema endosymbiont of Eucomonympha sp.]|uniref:hypothetical protein n=1 Tax=Treponema endosymbiont of Eucomonympha sp. TaxID=1580831 RepID=UPI001EE6A224|nr:hypothetical protein [Treponema endosymbiont of Eucomonympha sp.]
MKRVFGAAALAMAACSNASLRAGSASQAEHEAEARTYKVRGIRPDGTDGGTVKIRGLWQADTFADFLSFDCEDDPATYAETLLLVSGLEAANFVLFEGEDVASVGYCGADSNGGGGALFRWDRVPPYRQSQYGQYTLFLSAKHYAPAE